MQRAERSCLITLWSLLCFNPLIHNSTSRDVFQPRCDALSLNLNPRPKFVRIADNGTYPLNTSVGNANCICFYMLQSQENASV